MPNGNFSDPFLVKLVEKRPELANRFFTSVRKIGEGDTYGILDRLAKCLETPSEVLSTLGKEGIGNPNYPREKFVEFLMDETKFDDVKWYIFRSPLMNSEDLIPFFSHEDLDIRARALSHELGDPKLLLEFVEEVLSGRLKATSGVLEYICLTAKISDELFAILGPHLDRKLSEYSPDRFGDALAKNSNLKDEQKAFIALSGIPIPESNPSEFTSTAFLLSSAIWYPLFQEGNAGEKGDLEVIEALAEYGHPYSVLIPGELSGEYPLSIDGLHDLLENQYLHRLFWRELCERPDFEIYRRNAYRTDDLFISHPILGREFEATDYEEGWKVGGVFGSYDQEWLNWDQVLDVEQAQYLVLSSEESMLDALGGWGTIDNVGSQLCALAMQGHIDPEEIGFALTETSESFVVSAAEEYAEPADFDVTAELNPDFNEVLSWRKTPDSKMKALFDLLIMGRNIPIESMFKEDANHFLGCMALHESTPDFLIKELAALNDPLINEVIASR